jgi:acetoin utilization protein AcuC
MSDHPSAPRPGDPAGAATAGGASCPVVVVWDDRFLGYDFGPGHPFTERSRKLAVDLLEQAGFFGPPDGSPSRRRTVEPASSAALTRFHEPEYLELLARASEGKGPRFLDGGDTPSFPDCLTAAARIVGGTLAALDQTLAERGSHALQPAGGLHHAAPGRASGFCILNDLAVAIASAVSGPPRLRRVAYVDLDVHHGDGVMYGFYSDGRLLDLDVHQDGRTLFPGTGAETETGEGDGAGLKVNAPLPPGAGDVELLRVVHAVFLPRILEFRPELLVLQCGADGCAGDPLAQLRYTVGGLRSAIRALHEAAHEVGAAVFATGGGGYVPQNVALTLALAAVELTGGQGPFSPPAPIPRRWSAQLRSAGAADAPATWPAIRPLPEAGAAMPRVERLIERLRSRGPRRD